MVAVGDPNPQVAGQGVAALQAAGIEVEIGIGGETGRQIVAPYVKLVTTGRPWVIAKWAMTLDGKIAAATGDSQWITSEPARGRLCTGYEAGSMRFSSAAKRPSGTTRCSPPGRPGHVSRRESWRIRPRRSHSSRRCAGSERRTGSGGSVPAPHRTNAAGSWKRPAWKCCDVSGDDAASRLASLLDELGRREMTNLLVEGGGRLLGSLFDHRAIDEVHAFVRAKLIGGADAPSPIAGTGLERIADACRIDPPTYQIIGGDVYIHGRITA